MGERGLCPGGLFLGEGSLSSWSLSSWSLSSWSLSGGDVSVQVVSVQGGSGLCSGGGVSVQGRGLCPGESLSGTPPPVWLRVEPPRGRTSGEMSCFTNSTKYLINRVKFGPCGGIAGGHRILLWHRINTRKHRPDGEESDYHSDPLRHATTCPSNEILK